MGAGCEHLSPSMLSAQTWWEEGGSTSSRPSPGQGLPPQVHVSLSLRKEGRAPAEGRKRKQKLPNKFQNAFLHTLARWVSGGALGQFVDSLLNKPDQTRAKAFMKSRPTLRTKLGKIHNT